jgi:hypothetical protein
VTQQDFNLDLVVVGSGAAVHLVKALTEETPFGAELPNSPPGTQSSMMPAGAPPVIENWKLPLDLGAADVPGVDCSSWTEARARIATLL